LPSFGSNSALIIIRTGKNQSETALGLVLQVYYDVPVKRFIAHVPNITKTLCYPGNTSAPISQS
jgi:hypothetical protein